MKLAQRLAEALAIALVVALVITGSVLMKPRPAPDFGMHVSGATTLVCPSVDPAVTGTRVGIYPVTGDVAIEDTTSLVAVNKSLPTGTLTSLDKAATATEISTSNGGSAVGTAVTQSEGGADRGLAMSRCKVPAVEHYFVGMQSNKTTITKIVLTNADDAEAYVDLTFYSELGRVQAAGSKSVTVKPNSTVTVGLDSLFTQTGPIAVKVKASQGRVAAFARVHSIADADSAPRGVEWYPTVPLPRTHLVIPGIPEGPGERRLVLANFGDEKSTLAVQLLGPQGPFTLPGMENVSVNPGSLISLDLTKSLGGKGGSVYLVGSSPVVASVTATSADDTSLDIADAVPTLAIEQTAAIPMPVGSGAKLKLSLANPEDKPAVASMSVLDAKGKAIIEPRRIEVPARSTVFVEVPQADGSVVTVTRQEGIVHGALVATTSSDASKGLSVLPLTSVELDSTRINPVNDPRAGE